jgi:hypothetical protein
MKTQNNWIENAEIFHGFRNHYLVNGFLKTEKLAKYHLRKGVSWCATNRYQKEQNSRKKSQLINSL